MKARVALSKLGITRQTLTKYVKEGMIKVNVLPNSRYDYDDESVYAFLRGSNGSRLTVGYACTWEGDTDISLEDQTQAIQLYCKQKKYNWIAMLHDARCTEDMNTRWGMSKLLTDIISNKVERVVIYERKALSRTEFGLLQFILSQHNCAVIIVTES